MTHWTKHASPWLYLILTACSGIGGPSAEELSMTYVAGTAGAVTDTPLPTDASTSTETPLPPTATSTQEPTATTGPVVFHDDFSRPSVDWKFCEQCEWQDGGLVMGPYPISGAYAQHVAICGPCGLVRNYRMAVEVGYIDGPSERGFGLLVRLTNEFLMTYEITPWQDATLWNFDFDEGWQLVNRSVTGRIRTGRATNRIEVGVQDGTSPARVNIELKVNGWTIFLAYNQPADLGEVGLTLYGHGTAAVFDNFEFEELPPYMHEPLPPAGPPGVFGFGGGGEF